ncbi:glycoside hydrolase family 3 protein [Micromonospora zamorensis]|uniref:glycoside hydrolase family 3 N-terminal domain-containing protein n=1 Tax=Micromonospora TaxID=1873 RepID=UPI001B36EAE3|nr:MULTISPECIES: glycoside hydrolase family 3 N-terminal domain-containing protein [Micromonospora]MBQ0976900.1 glycoside hydrolase family 3 protein [Micromonospora sp. M61]MBQ1036391.1 glycoside hydrolase family 3 protein [Micromonospora sp. C81]WSK46888.1 glycoside hydrolase family 3 protein [Micromonospora zamorensis]
MGLDPGLRRLALGTLLAAYPGPVPPDWAVDLLADGLAGHTLFGTNVHDPAQVAASTAALRAGRPDALIAIDEEGGDVTRLAHATGSPYPGNAALGAIGDVALTRRVYQSIGAELAALGITVNLAPTVDVNTADDNPVIGTRSFGADPVRVAAHSAAAVTGLQAAGVAACAKHFPGHGATVTDSHHELPTVDAPLALLRQRDLPPFAAVVAAGARAVMTAHIRVPALTGTDPATFSRAVLVDLLRAEYGFTGTVITDALEMKGAAVAAGGVGPAAVRALAAGADLLCIGAKVDAQLVERVAAEIVDALTDGRLATARVEEAAGRAADLAAWTRAAVGSTAASDTELGYAAARRAVRVDGVLNGLDRALVVQLHTESTIAEGRVPWGLGPHLSGVQELRVIATETDPSRLGELAGDRPIVLVGRHLHRLPGGPELIAGLAAQHPVTVVEMGWPAQWRPQGVRAFVTTYGASHANGRAAAEALGLTG